MDESTTAAGIMANSMEKDLLRMKRASPNLEYGKTGEGRLGILRQNNKLKTKEVKN